MFDILSNMRDYLESQIEDRKQQLRAIDQQRLKLLAEIAAYSDALTHSGEPSEAIPTVASAPALSVRKRRARDPSQLDLSPAWFAIVEKLSGFKRFNARELRNVALELIREGKAVKNLTSGNARAQLSHYTKKGIIDRLGGGNYKVSNKTKVALEIRKQKAGENRGPNTTKLSLALGLGPEPPAPAQVTADDAR